MGKLSAQIAVYLPPREIYCPEKGGAVATWTWQVYGKRLPAADTFVVTVGAGTSYDKPSVHRCAGSKGAKWLEQKLTNRSMRGMLDPWKQRLRQSYASDAARLCSKLGARLIHIHNDPEAVIPMRRFNRSATLVLHMHNEHLIQWHYETAPAAVRASDWIAFCSKFLMEGALAKVEGLRRDRCFVIYNGADVVPAPRLVNGQFKSEKGPVILFAGRIVPEKGAHVLVDAMSQVLELFPSANVRIVGGVHFGSREIDSYLAGVRSKAAALGGCVDFVGPVSHSDINRYYDEADILVCPSLCNEGLGMVNLEAMGAGVPVVAFAKGGIPEAVGDAGVLVQEAAAAPLATALIRLLSDHNLRKELAIWGRERVAKRFTWDNIAHQWRERLKGLLKDRALIP